jgi:NtrC-family two-component system sensor histidine kinase KinB
LERIGRLSRSSLILLGLVLVGLIGALDYLTGPELSFSIFYLIPIALAAWFGGSQAGIFVSAMSTLSWLAADLFAQHHYSNPLFPFWNSLVRLGFFLIVTYTLSAVRAARARNEELSQFVVHDLRSPLSNVMIALETIQDIAGEKMDAVEQEMIEICLLSCQRMLTLINSLLDLARLEGGQMRLQASHVEVREVVELSLQQVSILARWSRVTLDSHLEAGIDRVYADPEVTSRVLVNLLSNAIKVSRQGSAVTLHIVATAGNELAFSIADQGPGIPGEWVDRVFDKFVQVDSQRKIGGAVGSGLGLTFCRLAVEAQGGRIWLESEEGKGTTVSFTLPVSDHVA